LQQHAYTAPISSTTTLNPLALSKKNLHPKSPKNKAENPQILLRKIPQPGEKSGDATRREEGEASGGSGGNGGGNGERGEAKKPKLKAKKRRRGRATQIKTPK
jgi:hypothetical protein